MRADPNQLPSIVTRVLSKAAQTAKDFGFTRKDANGDAALDIFTQGWGDTSCGHGGMAGQSATTAYTVVLTYQSGHGGVLVYQGGRLSYAVEHPNAKYLSDLQRRRLVGEIDYDGQYEDGA